MNKNNKLIREVIMRKNREKDFEFFIKRGITGIILSVVIMLALELAIVYYYLLIGRKRIFMMHLEIILQV